jgi:hypothetical protein
MRSGYAVHVSAGGVLSATNAAQRLSASFGAAGVSVSSGDSIAELRLAAVGFGGSLRALARVTPTPAADRVVYAHPGLTEWYANSPAGIEQGFELTSKPAAAAQLTIAIAIGGDMRARALGAHAAELVGPGGEELSYTGLRASDARGRALASWLSLDGRQLRLHVDLRGAVLPVRVDPYVAQQRLFAGGGLALSSNGEYAAVGASVYIRSGSHWTKQATLEPLGTANSFGVRAAISVEGTTAAVSGTNASGESVVWVFTRSGSSWTQQGEPLTAGGGENDLGASLALSPNGSMLLAGDDGQAEGSGAAYVFTRSGSVWSEQAKLTGGGESGEGLFGYSVALAAEDVTALVGGPQDAGNTGAVWVFTRSGSTWTQQGEKLVPPNSSGAGDFGDSVAVSGSGSTALVGAPFPTGRAWGFTRSGSTWSVGEELAHSGESGSGYFGESVALNEAGTTALVGGPLDDLGAGALWAFAKSGTWSQQGSKIPGGTEEGLGAHLAMSSNGRYALTNGGETTIVYTSNATATTGSASEITSSTALLSSTVNPARESLSVCEFEYGTTTSYGSTAPCTPKIPEGESPVPVSGSLSGLAASTVYHFRISVTGGAGTTFGADATFLTLAASGSATSKSGETVTASSGPLKATASGGTGTVTVGSYGSEVGGPRLPGGSELYADVFHSSSSAFASIELHDCEVGSARNAWWYEPGAGWELVAPAASFAGGCGSFTVTASTSPSLSQLTGTRVKFGEPPGSYGECRAGKDSVYSEAACLTVQEKKGVPDGKGKYEWHPVPVGCFPLKKGAFAESKCETYDYKKGKPIGKYETGNESFSAAMDAVKLEIHGAGTVECTGGSAAGSYSTPFKGSESLSLTGCKQGSSACATAGVASGTIATGALELVSYEEGGKYFAALTGEPVASFSCASNQYTLDGAVSGVSSGAVNAMSQTSELTLSASTGKEQLTAQHGSEQSAATLIATLTQTTAQPMELDSAVGTQ